MRKIGWTMVPFAVLGWGGPALAQDIGPALDPGLMVGWAGGEAVQSSLDHRAGITRGQAARMAAHGGVAGNRGSVIGVSSAVRRPPSPAAAEVSLAYASTPAVRQQALDAFVERLRAKNPQYAEVATREYGKHDYAQIYHGIVAPFGLHDDDAADALASYLVLGYLIASGAPDPSPASVKGVRMQIAGALARDPRFASPDGRSRLGEEMKLLFVTLHAGWQSARKEGNLPQFASGVRRMFQQQAGIDFATLSLGNGFEPRG